MSTLDLKLEPKATTVRRLEVITGAGGRRNWSDEDKARIIEEALVPGVVVSEIARRHGLSSQQLFTWRRQARRAVARMETAAPSFVPAVVEQPVALPRAEAPMRRSQRDRRATERALACGSTVAIELEIGGVTVRVGSGAEAETITAVIRALKAGP